MVKKTEPKAGMERVYNVPLGKIYKFPRTKRAMKAGKFLRSYIARHYRVEDNDVKVSNMVNSYIWRHGMKKPPRRIKVKTKRVDDRVYVFTMDEADDISKFKIVKEATPKKKEEPKEEKSKEEKGLKEEKPKKEEEVKETKLKKTKGEKLLESHKETLK